MARLAKTDNRSLALLAVGFALALCSSASHAADKVWTNGAGNNLFNNALNWQLTDGTATTVPGAADVAIFSSTATFAATSASTANCTIDMAASVAGISIRADYSGTVTQGAGLSLTVGASNFSIVAGSTGAFVGSNSTITLNGSLNIDGGSFTKTTASMTVSVNCNITGGSFDGLTGNMTISGSLLVSGGTFKCPTGTLTVRINLTFSGGTFNPNGGTVSISPTTTGTVTGGITFNNLTLTGGGRTVLFEAGSTTTVNGNLSMSGSSETSLLTIASSVGGTEFFIDPANVTTKVFLNVSDSNNLAAFTIRPFRSIDSGGTTNWFVLTEIFVRGDGGGNDTNGGTAWNDAFATMQKLLNTLDSSGPVTVNVQDGTYDVATRSADTGIVEATFEGGWVNVDVAPVQTGRTLITDGDATVDEDAFHFQATGGSHNQAKIFSFHLFDFAGVADGIHLLNQSNLDNSAINLTLNDCTFIANGDGVHLEYPRIGECVIDATACTILGGQNSGSGDALFMAGDPTTSSITDCTLTSAGGKGLHVLAECGGGSFGPGFTFNITDSSISDCSSDGIFLDDLIFAHYNTNSTVNLTRVKIANNGGVGFSRQQDDGNAPARFFVLNATNVLVANNSSDGIQLIGNVTLGGGIKGAPFQATLVNCTVADNGGDGLFLISDVVGSTSTVTTQNTIFAGNAGNGIDAGVIDGVTTGTMTVTDAICDFFGNASNNILVNGANQAISAGSLTADPLFCNLLPEPYQLSTTSTILDAGSAAFAPADDILGTSRPVGAADSIGAYEAGVAPFLANATANGVNPFAQGPPVNVTFDSNPTGGTGPYTYLWEDMDALAPAVPDNTNKSFSQLFTAEGDYVFQVTVTDSLGNTTTETVLVFITPPLSTAPTATPAAGFEATGEQWNLFANPVGGVPIPPVGTDPEYTYVWTVLTVGAVVNFNNDLLENPTATIVSPQDTLITIQVEVKDNVNTVATGTVDIIFASTALTAAPTVTHTASGQTNLTNVIVVIGESVDFSGTFSGGTGNPLNATFDWTETTEPFNSTAQNPSHTPATVAGPPPLTYTFTVTDENGLTDSATVTVTLVDPIVPVPVSTPAFIDLSLPGGGTSVLSVTATGGAPDAGGTYVTADWIDLTAGSTVIASGPFAATPTFTPTIVPGLNTVQVTVTDNLGFTGTATLDIFVVESGMTVTAEGTYVIAGTSITGTSLQIFAGDPISLAGTITGGSGVYLIAWTGPGGFTSSVEDPGTVTPPAVAGPYTYTLTVTDVNTGQIVVATVTVTSSDSINNQGLFVGNGKCKYKATTASTPETGKDFAKIRLEGVVFNTGDRVAFDFNGRPIGDIAGGSSIVLDENLKGTGQLGPIFGPNFFPKVTVKYKATRIRLDAKCLKGDFVPFAQGTPMTSAVTGLSPIVNVTVFVDRAPADGVVDDTIVLPLMFKVKAKMNAQGVFTESGKKVAP